MAGVKGPRPCLGLLGKGDWPLSTRAYPHRDTHLLTYTCWHTCNRPSTNSAASSSLFLSGRLLPSFAPSSSIAVLRSQNPALSRYELLCTRASAPACTSMHRSFAVDFYFRLNFPGPEAPHSLLRPPRSFREPLNSRRRINLESDRVAASLLHRRCINSVWLPETFYKFG